MDNWPSDVKTCVVEVTLKNGNKISQRIDYALLSTNEPLDRALFSFLSSRARLMRVR